MPQSRRCRWSILFAGLAFVVGYPDAQQAIVAADDSAIQRVIYFFDEGPLFLELELSIGGKEIGAYRREFIARQFAQFDSDDDQELSAKEAALVPAFGLVDAAAPTLGDAWKELDKSPQDDSISLDELATHYEAAMGEPFSLTRQIRETYEEVDLFSKLDANADRSIAKAEITGGLQRLIKLDLDDDETISAAELAPLFDPQRRNLVVNQNENAQEAYPFLLIAKDGDLSVIAATVITEYDGKRGQDNDGMLTEAEIPAAWKTLADSDSDGNGKLTNEEIAAALTEPESNLALTATLPRFGRARITPTGASRRMRDGRLTVEMGRQNVQFSVRKWSSDVEDSISFYKVRMLRIDADKNRYLNEEEFARLNLPNATFAQCDQDGDGHLYARELESFMRQRTTLNRCRLIMRIQNERRSLFQMLDTNFDRRLSHREFRDGFERVAEADADGDDLLEISELETQYKVTIELARTDLFSTMRRANTRTTDPRLALNTDGPEWFQRMDVNRDGEVSGREFLGPLSDFERLDANGDMALSAEEAQAAQ